MNIPLSLISAIQMLIVTSTGVFLLASDKNDFDQAAKSMRDEVMLPKKDYEDIWETLLIKCH